MTEPTPITPGIVPSVDGEREFIDYLAGRVRKYCERHGHPPHSAAVVLLGVDGGGEAHSWSPHEGTLRHTTCAVGAWLLTKRALEP